MSHRASPLRSSVSPLRIALLWLLGLGLGAAIGACGGGATGDQSLFDGGHGDMDSGHVGRGDVTLKTTNPDANHVLMGSDGGGPTCPKNTCAKLNATCGEQSDGCGGMLQCGTCISPATCGGGGVANHCGTPVLDAGDGGMVIPTGPISISPTNKAITVVYGQHTPTVLYTAAVGGTPVAASFSIDLGQIGIIDPSTGIMTPSGLVGGVAHVTATFGTQSITTPLTVTITQTQNGASTPDGGVDAGDAGNAGGNGGVGGSPAGGPVSLATEAVLEGTPTADSSLSWLYPYDNTVWPQGILAPLLQWTTTKTYSAVAITLTEQGYSYTGYFSAPVAGQAFINVPIQQSVWDTLVYSNAGTADPVTVSLVFATAAGVAYGPITETWVIAPGTLTGTVYYNSYGTALAVNYPGSNGYPNFGGATLAIKHGATSPVLVAGKSGLNATNSNCRVCHSVAAGGSALVTQQGNNYQQSSTYSLTSGDTETVMPPAAETAANDTYGFAAIYPDGTFLLGDTGPLPGESPLATSGLYSLPAGAAIAATGLPAKFSAATPSFSPDGTHIAFNQYGVDKVSLAAMAFVQATNTFSGLTQLTKPATGTTDLFPAFLPTNDAVIYEHEIKNAGEFGATRSGVEGQLWWVDLATQTAAPLNTLNGLLPSGTSYLPNYGTNHASDQDYQYEPTVNPVPSGGYAWVVFTSRRLYGNVATQDPFLSDPRNYNATIGVTTKKLWVAAIDLNAAPGTDPSHPAFYLPAQELHACNSRGYWVVDPCEASGTSCLTGDQCCSGYCGPVDGGFACGTQPAGCAVIGNKCTMTSDCCGASTGISCIDGFCALPTVTHDAGGCTPTTCQKLGIACGPAGDGCGGLLECGTCTAPASCGGGGTAGVCGMQSGPP